MFPLARLLIFNPTFQNHTNFFSNSEISRELNLRAPIYQDTSCYGHFGRSCFAWEQAKVLDVDWLDEFDGAHNGDSKTAKKAKYS